MSYDLTAFRLPPGVDAATYYEEYEADEDERPPAPEEREVMERLAEAILAVDPTAERHDGDDFIEISSAKAIQVSLYAEEAGISVPYWYEGEEAEAVMERMQEYAKVLTEVGGYTVFDAQTEEVVTGPGASDVYYAGVDAVKRLAEEDEQPRKRRWFWQR